jgi:hypothetical protein
VRPEKAIIEIQQLHPMDITELVVFYLRAVERFRTHALAYASGGDQLSNESRARGALAEALNWADSIDNYLSKGPRDTKGTDRDQNWAATIDGANGELVQAFQYARNHVHHQWLNLVGTRLHSGDQAKPSEWYWAKVPSPPQSGSRKSKGADEYQRQMYRAIVLTTLDRLGQAFWEKRTWAINRSEIVQPGYDIGADLRFDPEVGKS